jgi:pimeloyl-ACP methyl ester carboxylesterase
MMDKLPKVRYVRSGDVSIAYSRFGEGDDLVVYTPPLVSNIELMWELPEWERGLRWAWKHHQIILIDKRGVGLSDRVQQPSTLQENVDDVLAVLDAEGIESAHFAGQSEGGTIAIALAATHPERVKRLCLFGVPAMGIPYEELRKFDDPVHPLPSPEATKDMWLSILRTWGQAESNWLSLFGPTIAADPRVQRWAGRFERQSASAGAVLAMLRGFESFDLRPFFDRVKAPTYIGHVVGDKIVPLANGRALASALPHAQFTE